MHVHLGEIRSGIEPLWRWTRKRGFDAIVLAVPADAAVSDGLGLLRGGGQVLLFAHTKRGASTNVDLSAICVDEKDLLGSYSSDIRLQTQVSRLVFSRKLDVRPLIRHTFPLREAASAVALAAKPTPDSLKVVVACEETPLISRKAKPDKKIRAP
jgi:L-iditol 2-dehydrogenase